MTQREGRILRQGNTNKEVFIYRYITEGSFDAYSWQLLETKQRFITGILSGSLEERSGSDIENTVLDYAEVKALAVGNPLVKERVETANELSRYQMLQRKLIDNRIRLEKELMDMPGRMQHQEDLIIRCREDMNFYQKNKREYEKEDRQVLRKEFFAALKENILEVRETPLFAYQGFQILLPANMKEEKPYVWLLRKGRYYVELGNTEVGNLIRIDNFLENLSTYLENLKKKQDDLMLQEIAVRAELEKKESYTDQIEQLRQKLEKIDKKLGVKRK